MAASEELDLELITAFIDGRLTGAERERAVKLLADSEEAFEVYTDALRVRADLEARPAMTSVPMPAQQSDKVIPIGPARSRRSRPWVAIGSLAAAAAVVFAVLPRMQATGGDLGAPSSEIAMAITRRPDLARALPADWDQRDWSVTRGGGARVVDTTAAFRLGVRAVDLQVALAAGNTLQADQLAAEMVQVLERVELSDMAKAEYVGVRSRIATPAPNETLGAVAARAEQSLDDLFDSFWFDFGRWVGAGELAAATRSREFFADAQTARFLDKVVSRPELSQEDVELVRAVAGPVKRGVTDGDYDTIRQNLRVLIRRHGR